jgi:organic radical activating enzyme
MPQLHTLKINEIFPSFQGEGLRSGLPSLFVRFSGCNLRCSFCDTKEAWEKGKNLSPQEIISQVIKIQQAFPTRWVCLTGGEPLLQDIAPLVWGLKNNHFHIQLETNASLYRPLPIDWITVSPKPPSYFLQSSYVQLSKEAKILTTKDLTLDVIEDLRKKLPADIPIFLQPVSNLKSSMARATALLKKATAKGLTNIRLGIQLHKIYGFR